MMRTTAGFTLVEILIAMALSAILMLALVQVSVTHSQLYQTQQQAMQVLENKMMLGQFLKRQTSRLNSWQCANGAKTVPDLHALNASWGYKHTAIWGGDGQSDADSDALYFVLADIIAGVAPLAWSSNTLSVSAEKFKLDDWLMLSDCQHRQVFKVQSIQSTPNSAQQLTLNNIIAHEFHPAQTMVYRLSSHHYSVSEGRTNLPALFYALNGKRPQELIAGVKSVQWLYAVDKPNADRELHRRSFYSAKQMDERKLWPNLTQIRVEATLHDAERNFAFTVPVYQSAME